MLQMPTSGVDIDFDDWSILGAEAVVIGKITQTEANVYSIQFQLFDVFGREQLVGYRMPASRGTMRRTAHRAADMIYEKLTGIPGVFGTKVAYVTAKGQDANRQYSLVVADADGENESTIMESGEPDHVAGMVARQPATGLCLVRRERVRNLRTDIADRQPDQSIQLPRHQRFTGVFTGWQEARADAGRCGRQPGYSRTGSVQPGT